MNLRRERSHKTGLSNIDFRSKKDKEKLSFFQPWVASRNFGTMGNKNYFPSFTEKKRVFSAYDRIKTHRDLASGVPDPRYYDAANYYKENKIPLNVRAIFTNDRVGQLEECFKGKDVFNGDGMGISDLIHKRKQIKT